MIWESGPWKRELLRLAMALERRKSQKLWRQDSGAKLEKEIFFAAYAIRKLIEAKKISDEVESKRIECKEFPRLKEAIDFLNWHRVDEFFNFSEPNSCCISLREFCNQVIHSFVFMACLQEDTRGLAGFCLASERQMANGLLYFDISVIISILQSVSHDDIVTCLYVRNEAGGPMRVVKKSNRIDPSIL